MYNVLCFNTFFPQKFWRKLKAATGIDDTQLQAEMLTARHLLELDSEIAKVEGTISDATRPAQGRQEHQRGEVCQADQSRIPPLPTEEHRVHAAFPQQLQGNSQGRPESGNEVEMQMHSKVAVNFLVLLLLLCHKISFNCIILAQTYNNRTTCL